MRFLLCFALLTAASINAHAATYLLLSQTNAFAAGITNKAKSYSDSLTNTVVLMATNSSKAYTDSRPGGFAGAVSNAVASAGLLAVDSTKTNGIAATSAMVSGLQTNVSASNPTATVATTAVNGTAATFMRSDASPAIPASFITANQTNATLASLSGVAKTGGTDNTGTLYFPFFAAGSYQQYADSNTQSTATLTLDFSSTNYHVIVLTGACTIASSNLGTNRNWSGEFWNTGASNNAVTWPSWRFVGGKTTTIDPSQTMRLFARVPLLANDTNVIAVSSQTQ